MMQLDATAKGETSTNRKRSPTTVCSDELAHTPAKLRKICPPSKHAAQGSCSLTLLLTPRRAFAQHGGTISLQVDRRLASSSMLAAMQQAIANHGFGKGASIYRGAPAGCAAHAAGLEPQLTIFTLRDMLDELDACAPGIVPLSFDFAAG